MRNRPLLFLMASILAFGAISSEAYAKKDKLNISVVIDDQALKGKPEQVMSAWLGYAMARANWISDHVKVGTPEAKSYSRSFEEEVTGRESLLTIWGELKANAANLTDQYLDQLQKVKAAGLLREYVWANLRSPNWQTPPADLQLERYATWSKDNLTGHVVETHGDARIGGAEAK